MKNNRNLLFATIAAGSLLAGFGAWAAGFAVPLSPASSATTADTLVQPISADDDDDDDDGKVRIYGQERRHEDRRGAYADGKRHHDDEDDDDDRTEGYGRANGAGPAPAGSTTPPDNGLILKGSVPKVQMN